MDSNDLDNFKGSRLPEGHIRLCSDKTYLGINSAVEVDSNRSEGDYLNLLQERFNF